MLCPGITYALEFQWGEASASLDNIFSVGALWRMERPDPNLISKSNLQPGLCLRDTGGGAIRGNGCNTTGDPAVNDDYVRQPGSFAPNLDNSTLNYDRGEIAYAAAKITSDLTMKWKGWNLFARGVYFYDDTNHKLRDRHPDTTFQPAFTKRSREVDELIGTSGDILDLYIGTTFTMPFLGGRELTVRLGDQVINWGESTFLVLNSINSVNAISAARLRLPGFDVKELFIPEGMLFLATQLTDSLSIEGFYQYEWEPVIPDPNGSFFGTVDAVTPGGTYAMLSFGKAPEDPNQSYDPSLNPDDGTGLLSSSSRTMLRGPDRLPPDGGQYGVKLGYLAEWLNDGTELGFYYMNYHSRLPIVSFIAADASCAFNADTSAEFIAACQPGLGAGSGVGTNGNGFGRAMFAREPLPVETTFPFVEYPEDIRLFGFSFNTSLGNWAWSGEVAYRPSQPLQIHSTDLNLASLQPAFPAGDIPVCVGPGLVVDGTTPCLPGTAAAVVPGRRSAVPDFVETRFRGNTVLPGAYIRGYEERGVFNIGTTFLNTVGGDNFLKADQIVLLLEVGATYVEDFPGLDELQFNGPGTDTHISDGADGTTGVGGNQLGAGCQATGADARSCRQNPTAEKTSNFPTRSSWGYRAVTVLRYQDAFLGINLEPLIGVFDNVSGIGPGPGENFIEGTTTGLLGLRFDYLSKWSGEIRYTAEGGGAPQNNQRRDRDNLMLFLRYAF